MSAHIMLVESELPSSLDLVKSFLQLSMEDFTTIGWHSDESLIMQPGILFS
jgi:hypothetical protein